MVRIGAHVRDGDPLALALATGTDVVQFFLGDPQGWKAPTFPGGDAAALREAIVAAGVDAFIHAPYVINVASTNNRIRIPSRKLLSQQLVAAATIGAKGLIVHGGHVTAGTGTRGRHGAGPRRVGPTLGRARRGDRGRWHRCRRRGDWRGGVLPGYLPRLCEWRGTRRHRGPGQGHHRPDRPGALQQLTG